QQQVSVTVILLVISACPARRASVFSADASEIAAAAPAQLLQARSIHLRSDSVQNATQGQAASQPRAICHQPPLIAEAQQHADVFPAQQPVHRQRLSDLLHQVIATSVTAAVPDAFPDGRVTRANAADRHYYPSARAVTPEGDNRWCGSPASLPGPAAGPATTIGCNAQPALAPPCPVADQHWPD